MDAQQQKALAHAKERNRIVNQLLGSVTSYLTSITHRILVYRRAISAARDVGRINTIRDRLQKKG